MVSGRGTVGHVTASLLFVHSPLVGPSSLRRLADLAATGGSEVAMPDLTPMATAAHLHEDYTNRAIEAAGDLASPVAVIGHSGAGPFLPTIGAAVGPEAVLVFVDAVVPPQFGSHRTPEAMKEMVDQQTVNGTLRQWLDWWPPEVVAEILPDPADREQLASDMPSLPPAFYDYGVAVPPRVRAGVRLRPAQRGLRRRSRRGDRPSMARLPSPNHPRSSRRSVTSSIRSPAMRSNEHSAECAGAARRARVVHCGR